MTALEDADDGPECPNCGETTKLAVYADINVVDADQDQVAPVCRNPHCDSRRLSPMVPIDEAADYDWQGHEYEEAEDTSGDSG